MITKTPSLVLFVGCSRRTVLLQIKTCLLATRRHSVSINTPDVTTLQHSNHIISAFTWHLQLLLAAVLSTPKPLLNSHRNTCRTNNKHYGPWISRQPASTET